MKNLISIIVPIYNSEKWLERCIKSIVGQSYKEIEIILIDDGSIDSSGIICDDFAKKDKRIKVIHKKNGGVSTARNIGLKKSKGKYIKFVDSDDTLEVNCCEILINEIEKKNVDLVICGLNIYKSDVLLRTPHLDNKVLSINKSIEDFKYISKVFASPCNKLYKKKYITKLFNQDLSVGEDLYFNLDYLKNCHFISCISNCVYNVFLDNNNSLNRTFRDDRLEISLILVKAQINFCDLMYGKNNYDKTFLNNLTLLNVHSYFRDVTRLKKYSFFKEMFKKYQKNTLIKLALDDYKFDRKDYTLFSILLKKNQCMLCYFLFKIKIFLSKK